ncbi:unnamed protein product [Parnassius apollo]|uniref:(apollo) hypothetical protein n=1 Tax=Parnassius apollo TaxID=110799 RepID=A0A8S3XNF2_PARAO|nr:unnamed protein product [Parnassius apollo]
MSIFESLSSQINQLRAVSIDHGQQDPEPEDHGNYEDCDSNVTSNSDIATESTWRAPGIGTVQKSPMKIYSYDFIPVVAEVQPSIPRADHQTEEQRYSCQKMNLNSWNKIKYKDVQKHLHAAPVFSALKVNPQLTSLGKLTSHSQKTLARTDTVLGTITYCILKEREQIEAALNEVEKKNPEAVSVLKQSLFAKSDSFKQTSDDLLHYTCTRRSEMFENRRRIFKPRSEFLATKLKDLHAPIYSTSKNYLN